MSIRDQGYAAGMLGCMDQAYPPAAPPMPNPNKANYQLDQSLDGFRELARTLENLESRLRDMRNRVVGPMPEPATAQTGNNLKPVESSYLQRMGSIYQDFNNSLAGCHDIVSKLEEVL